jgi:GNAT superfamily N-acetyltransferase
MFKLRVARPDERQRLVELQRRASLANPNDRAAIRDHPEAIDIPAAQMEAGNVTVAELSGVLVGFSAIYLRNDRDAELDGLFVEPAFWKGGAGRALVEAAAARAIFCGARKLDVIGNPHAEIFYKKLGFVTTGEAQTQFGPGHLMELVLA